MPNCPILHKCSVSKMVCTVSSYEILHSPHWFLHNLCHCNRSTGSSAGKIADVGVIRVRGSHSGRTEFDTCWCRQFCPPLLDPIHLLSSSPAPVCPLSVQWEHICSAMCFSLCRHCWYVADPGSCSVAVCVL